MEPLTHPRDPQEEEQRDPGRWRAASPVRSLDLVLGAEGTPAEELKDCNTQLVFLKSILFSVV